MQSALLALACLLLSTAGGAPDKPNRSVTPPRLAAEDGWIRLPPPIGRMAAGYVVLRNDGPEAVQVTGASSPRFASVSVHRTVLVEGVSRMRAVERLLFEPGQTHVLEPGGLHLMLMRPSEPLKQDEVVAVRLEFADGGHQTLNLPVKKR